MGILTFKGGVHPYDGKELSKNSPVVKYLPKGDMVYPLSQHIGAPAAAIVQKGDHVLAGQKIADAAGFVSSPIHSSVSGTVKGIEPRRLFAPRKALWCARRRILLPRWGLTRRLRRGWWGCRPEGG